MVYYLYLDPELFVVAEKGGPLGLSCLFGILQGIQQNCFLAEFEDWFVQGELKEKIQYLQERIPALDPDGSAELAYLVKRFKSVLSTLDKRNRFIYCLTSKGESSPSDRLASVFMQGGQAELDLVFAMNPGAHPNPYSIPTATLSSYAATPFEARRSDSAAHGMLFTPRKVDRIAFLEQTLRKALKHCSVVHIYDEVMGAHWGDNFEYTLESLLDWLQAFIEEPTKKELHLYCSKPSGFTDLHMKQKIRAFCRGRLKGIPIKIHFHETRNAGSDVLPHDRFLLTDKIAIEIGRGMDFLEKASGMNRDASLNLKDLDELTHFLHSMVSCSQAPVDC